MRINSELHAVIASCFLDTSTKNVHNYIIVLLSNSTHSLFIKEDTSLYHSECANDEKLKKKRKWDTIAQNKHANILSA